MKYTRLHVIFVCLFVRFSFNLLFLISYARQCENICLWAYATSENLDHPACMRSSQPSPSWWGFCGWQWYSYDKNRVPSWNWWMRRWISLPWAYMPKDICSHCTDKSVYFVEFPRDICKSEFHTGRVISVYGPVSTIAFNFWSLYFWSLYVRRQFGYA